MKLGRLYHRIYLSLLLVAMLTTGSTACVVHHLFDQRARSPLRNRLTAEAEHIGRSLPPASAPAVETETELRRLAAGLDLDAALLDGAGVPLVATVEAASQVRRPLPRHGPPQPGWMLTSYGPALVIRLDDGRLLSVWPRGGFPSLWVVMLVFFPFLAAGCLPIARGLARRLEALEQGVARLGSGELGTRVSVEGRDEIAHLAERFNWSAERIERLVEAQRRMLLSASHELRSPLARLRMALELIRDSGGPAVEARVAAAVGDVRELDVLVDDILLASRIDAQDQSAAEPVDLAALMAEEGARAGAQLELKPVTLRGDARLLRRLVRNLLDNAVRYGNGTEISAGVAPLEPAGGQLWVADRGPGVAAFEQERIFEPFYRSSRTPDAAGVGLGLALVRQIAEHHGGEARCRARDGGGAVFEVLLPGAAPAAAR